MKFRQTSLLTIPQLLLSSASALNLTFTFPPLLRNLHQQIPLSFPTFSTVTANMTRLAPVISISHGGGPMPILGDPSQANLTKSMKTRVPKILKLGTAEQPRAIVLVTAHWSTDVATVSSAERHELLYDYYGFPPEAYELKYDAPGSPEVANDVWNALREAGIEVKKDGKRGWDHGVFVPMTLIHPAATIPIIQLSVLTSESPSTHYAIGLALSSLRRQNIAIVGSGFASLHNLRSLFSGQARTKAFKELNEEWSRTVTDAVQTESTEGRGKKFAGWRNWAGSYDMHPRGGAEHFLPLIVCAGAAAGVETETEGAKSSSSSSSSRAKAFSDEMYGLEMWSYYWE